MKHIGLVAPNSTFTFHVPESDEKTRLDRFIADQFPYYSRSYFQHLIKHGHVSVNGKIIDKYSLLVSAPDTIIIQFPAERTLSAQELAADTLSVDIIFEHEHFLIVNKPSGLIVHAPNLTSTEPTLVDWIKHNYKDVANIGAVDRPGIVHRLDKDTSGLLIIPRTNYAHAYFGSLFRERDIHKTYYAIVEGHPHREGTIDLAIGRDPVHRKKMKTFKIADPYLEQKHGIKIRNALSHYKVLEYFPNHSLVEVKPVTGRTHQIRVHMAAISHPLVGDHLYGTASSLFDRHALHAGGLSFSFDGKDFEFKSDMPQDMQELITTLRTHTAK
ncbi:MAG TPA: RluA family pseudouridine synthase [Candidatus Dependentiae bacterium]|nr:RluA family pseudouridine synthase [Candidatus Dependentiae bacterium]HRQ62913.1 RluA family pseudouridine synthase [Candidatus Dependentiae bacterium]